MCTKTLLEQILNKLAIFSHELFGDKLDKIILYGSYARGDFDDESDIDVMIMVDLPPHQIIKYRRYINDYCADLNLDNGVFITPQLQSISEFNEWKNYVSFYSNVEKEGIKVYG